MVGNPVALDFWRILGTSSSLQAGLVELTHRLARAFPVAGITVHEVDVARSRLVGVDDSVGVSGVGFGKVELSTAALQDVVEACQVGTMIHVVSREQGGSLARAIPRDHHGEAFVVAMTGPHGIRGIAVILAAPSARFESGHGQVVNELTEPLAWAMDAHCRLHRLATERETAEAERRSLLSRLGRSGNSETIVGADSGLQQVMEHVAQVAQSDVPVLVFGETGTGKEVVARAIHNRSHRRHGPVLRVNCGAIPAELVDSELFGHERGSFTGATQMRKGWFERADGGTLFLDEVAELSHAAQVRLLRVLQDGTFERVGGQQLLRVDVRIVAATHRDLIRMVGEGRFREDLWYRLAIFTIDLPPLRERPQDMAALATHFALRASQRFGLTYQAPSHEDVMRLAEYSWPGNIRELATVINRAAILGNGRRLEIAQALGVNRSAAESRIRGDTPRGTGRHNSLTLEEVIRNHIEQTLEHTKGRVEGPFGAAALLEVNPNTLRSRMRRLGVDWRRFRHQ